jgi:hypothetical protein
MKDLNAPRNEEEHVGFFQDDDIVINRPSVNENFCSISKRMEQKEEFATSNDEYISGGLFESNPMNYKYSVS